MPSLFFPRPPSQVLRVLVGARRLRPDPVSCWLQGKEARRGRPNKYPEEFRREAVELYRSSDRPRVGVAKSHGLADGWLVSPRLTGPATRWRLEMMVSLPPNSPSG